MHCWKECAKFLFSIKAEKQDDTEIVWRQSQVFKSQRLDFVSNLTEGIAKKNDNSGLRTFEIERNTMANVADPFYENYNDDKELQSKSNQIKSNHLQK